MQMIKNMNHRKVTGNDNIPGQLIRNAYMEISFPICCLWNASTTAKSFPSIMKYADVSPCFKRECTLFKGNCRPISVFSVISKLNMLFQRFRIQYNCQSFLLKLIEDIKSVLDKAGAVFMDLSKAFDCLLYALSIAKLNVYDLSPAACKLMSYLY